MSDLLTISAEIESLKKELRERRGRLKQYGIDKAQSIGLYEKAIALTLIGLSNGKEYDLDGQKVVNPAVSIQDKLSRGICYKEKIKMEESEAMYKSLIVSIETIQAELNATQSVLKYLDIGVRHG